MLKSIRATFVAGMIFSAFLPVTMAAASPQFRATPGANATGSISEAAPGKLRGGAISTAEFRLGIFKFTCERVTTTGTTNSEAFATLVVAARFADCVTYLMPEGSKQVIPFQVRFSGPIDIAYNADGSGGAGAESESEIAIVNPSPVTAKVVGTGCLITWPPQTLITDARSNASPPYSAVTISNEEIEASNLKLFPTGLQKVLILTNEFLKLTANVEGGKCALIEKPEAKSGYFKATVVEALVRGDLQYL